MKVAIAKFPDTHKERLTERVPDLQFVLSLSELKELWDQNEDLSSLAIYSVFSSRPQFKAELENILSWMEERASFFPITVYKHEGSENTLEHPLVEYSEGPITTSSFVAALNRQLPEWFEAPLKEVAISQEESVDEPIFVEVVEEEVSVFQNKSSRPIEEAAPSVSVESTVKVVETVQEEELVVPETRPPVPKVETPPVTVADSGTVPAVAPIPPPVKSKRSLGERRIALVGCGRGSGVTLISKALSDILTHYRVNHSYSDNGSVDPAGGVVFMDYSSYSGQWEQSPTEIWIICTTESFDLEKIKTISETDLPVYIFWNRSSFVSRQSEVMSQLIKNHIVVSGYVQEVPRAVVERSVLSGKAVTNLGDRSVEIMFSDLIDKLEPGLLKSKRERGLG